MLMAYEAEEVKENYIVSIARPGPENPIRLYCQESDIEVSEIAEMTKSGPGYRHSALFIRWSTWAIWSGMKIPNATIRASGC